MRRMNVMNDRFPQYSPDYISNVMSLRKPQEDSLKILDKIINSIALKKEMNLKLALGAVHAMYPICSDFERDFMSLTFALATGVGKTRLMGAFISYLYTQYNIRNYFVVAPGTTVYEKLKKDLSDISSDKYIFKGLGCFSNPPQIITDDEYKEQSVSLFESEVRIYIFNIDKFNKENASMKKINEVLGESFFSYLSNLPDLVLIMDESHHYRAERGAQALNDLTPLMGLELTATPLVTNGNQQVPFKNVVFEYPLSKAIEDGYTRTPFAVTRSDINFYNFGEEQLDKLMILDGIACHEKIKSELLAYHINNNMQLVKPFMMIVCKDTDHAKWVEDYVKSAEFKDGKYKNKTIVLHSKQRGSESEANTRLLLDVENPDNPVEIVIHVNMLKEGWDVNNLYTIVPLRTAASKILREQMVGRGLRLPFGKRTGETNIDAVMLTAHDKFQDIIDEAMRGDSIFKTGNIIKVEDVEKQETTYTQVTLEFDTDKKLEEAYSETGIEKNEKSDELLQQTTAVIAEEVKKEIQETAETVVTEEKKKKIVEKVTKKIIENKDLGEVFAENENPLLTWINGQVEKTHVEAVAKFIPIPKIKVTDAGVEEYAFVDFDLDLAKFTHVPIDNKLLIQNLEDLSDTQRIKGETINFDGYNPKKILVEELRKKPEIDYEKTECATLLKKLITQLCDHYERKYFTTGMQNIIMMYKRDIANKIYNQMMQHFYCENGFLQEEVIGTSTINVTQVYNFEERVNIFAAYTKTITSVLFDGLKRCVFDTAKFDSKPELYLAQALERDKTVNNWLRPAPTEFNITYNRGHRYEPDFVVETDDIIYLIEVKGEDKLDSPDVIEKKKCAIKYCEVATRWCKANSNKEWQHLFIPSQQVQSTSTVENLAKRFHVTSESDT